MNGHTENNDRPLTDTLIDFVEGVDNENPLDIEVAVNETGRVVLFHNRKFREPIAWFEYDLDTCKLDVVLEDGSSRDSGMPLKSSMSKYMQNSHQILTVHLDDDTGEAVEGTYIPLIIHKA